MGLTREKACMFAVSIVLLSVSIGKVFAQQLSCMDLINNGIMYEGTNHYSQAEQYLKAAEIAAKLPYEIFESSMLLGDLYVLQNQYKEAETKYRKCLTLSLKDAKNGAWSVSEPEQRLADLYLRTGRNHDASVFRTMAKKEEKNDDPNNDPALNQYMEQLQQEIKDHWYPERTQIRQDTEQSLQTVCRWLVSRSGKFSSIHLGKGSGNYQLDRAGLAAVKAMSAPPLPAGCQAEDIGIEFTFKYNVRY